MSSSRLNDYKSSDVKLPSHNERENKYKVGDYVYIEQSQSDPFVIRRIDELQKTAQGNVAAKVVCFYERILFYFDVLFFKRSNLIRESEAEIFQIL